MLLLMCEPHSMQAEASGWHTIPVLWMLSPGMLGRNRCLIRQQVTAQLYRILVASVGLRPNPETDGGC